MKYVNSIRQVLGLFLLVSVSSAIGCQALISSLAPGLVRGAVSGKERDPDTKLLREERARERDRGWKNYWRTHPDSNQEMYEKYKDDYE